jgi:hypothetical protein
MKRSIRSLLFPFVMMLSAPGSLLAARAPYTGTPIALPGQVEAENYDFGGEAVAWHDTTPGNQLGVYRTDDMDVGAIAAGGYHIGNLANGEWAQYYVNIPASGSYQLSYRYSVDPDVTTKLPATFRIFLAGVDLLGPLTILPTGSPDTYVTTQPVTVTLAAGTFRTLQIKFDQGQFNLDWVRFTQPCTAAGISNPENRTVSDHTMVRWTLIPSGSPAPSIQWYKENGGIPVAIPGATSATLDRTNVEQGTDGGLYYATATNGCGAPKTSTKATLRVKCDGPEEMLDNVARAVTNHPDGDVCDWASEPFVGFPDDGGHVGYNKPVLNAATAFIRERIRPGVWDMNEWWVKYLQGELGDRAGWYLGGDELFSANYEAYNMASVLAVHFQARKTGRNDVRELSRRWLKAKFALHAITAVPNQSLNKYAKGLVDPFLGNYVGPQVMMAGERTSWAFWDESDRSTMFAQAVGLANNGKGENPSTTEIRNFVEPSWSSLPSCSPACNTNVYGLTAADQTALRNTVSAGTIPPGLVSNFLGAGLRTKMRYNFIAWPGVRATLMERNYNTNTTPTHGVVLLSGPREAHFLYPWQGLFNESDGRDRHGINSGWGRLDLPLHFMEAGHDVTSVHQAETVRYDNLPTGPYSYWVILDPARPPCIATLSAPCP